jgi:hypothetical protein
MGSPRTDLVSTLPTESLKVALNFVKGQIVSPRDMAIAAENIFSYAADQFLPDDQPVPMFATRGSMHAIQAAPQADIEAAFTRVMAQPKAAKKDQPAGAAASPKAAAADVAQAEAAKLDWQTILQTLLPFILGLFK